MASTAAMMTVQDNETVEQRIALYCRASGLDHVRVVEEITADIIRRVRQAGHEPDDADFVRLAVAELMTFMRACFDRLVPDLEAQSPDARHLLPWRLRAVLRQHPEVFYRAGVLPEDARMVLGRARRPVLPVENQLDMSAQKLGTPLGVRFKSFWIDVWGRLVRLGRAVFRGLASLGRERG